MHFWVTSDCCMGIICLNNPTKSCLAVILRGQPSFYDHWLTRYGFGDIFVPPGYFRATAPLFSDSPRVIESVSEEKMNLYGRAHGR